MKNELAIFQRVQSGDWGAFNLLFEAYSKPLYTYAIAFVKNRQVAEDIIQDAFIYLWTKREKITCQGSIYGYLLRSVRNACLNHKERTKIEKKYQDYIRAHPKECCNDHKLLEELHAQAIKYLDQLPDKCREVFILGCLDGISYAGISARLNISINTVKTQMQRARGKLRTLSNKFVTLFTVLVAYHV